MHLYEKTAVSTLDKANLFNEFFESVYTKECLPLNFDSIPQLNNENTLNTTSRTDSEVYTALSRLHPTKACGIDGIGPKILHSSALALYQVIHHLFSVCLLNCNIPTDWKLHGIIPMYKSGDKSLISNYYRPILLLCSISKVLEKLVYDKFLEFIHSSISNFQFGF